MHSLGSPGPQGLQAQSMKASPQQPKNSKAGPMLLSTSSKQGSSKRPGIAPWLCRCLPGRQPSPCPAQGTQLSALPVPPAALLHPPHQNGMDAPHSLEVQLRAQENSLVHTKNPPVQNQGLQSAPIPHQDLQHSPVQNQSFQNSPGPFRVLSLCSLHPPCCAPARTVVPEFQAARRRLAGYCIHLASPGKKFHKDIQTVFFLPAVNSSHTN